MITFGQIEEKESSFFSVSYTILKMQVYKQQTCKADNAVGSNIYDQHL